MRIELPPALQNAVHFPVSIHFTSAAPQAHTRALYVFDAELEGLDLLISSLPQSAEVLCVARDEEAFSKITAALEAPEHFDELVLVAHGAPGRLSLGRTALTAQSVEVHADLVNRWGELLSSNAKIILSGCHTGAEFAGRALTKRLAALTGREVSAADGELGRGAWDLAPCWQVPPGWAAYPYTLGDEFTVNQEVESRQTHPQVTQLADGRVLFTWDSDDPDVDGDLAGISGRIGTVQTDGSVTFTDEFIVNQEVERWQEMPQVTQLADGRVLFTWMSEDPNVDPSANGDNYGISGRFGTIQGDGSITFTDEFTVNQQVENSQSRPQVIQLADERLLFTWDSLDLDVDGSFTGISGRIGTIQADGSVTFTDEFTVNQEVQGSQASPQVTQLADGRLLFTWPSLDPDVDGDDYGISGRLGTIQSDGSVTFTDEFTVNQEVESTQSQPQVIQLADGRLLFTWHSVDPDVDGDNNGISGRLGTIQGDGSVTFTDEFTVNQEVENSQSQSQVVQLADGRVLFTWFGTDPDVDGDDDGSISARIGTFDGDGSLAFTDEFAINEQVESTQLFPQVIQLADGRVLFTWESADPDVDGDLTGISGRVLTLPDVPPASDIRLYVVDADTDEVLRELLPGDTIDPAEFPDNNFAIMAEVAEGVGEDSLVFYVDGEAVKTENLVPYAIFGDSSGDFRGGPVFSDGPHTVSATAFSGANGTGTALATVAVDVTVGEIDTPSVSIDDVTISEGDSGTTVATFTVTRSGDTAAFDVDFATADGTATVADGDYVANTGTLSFAEGVNTQTIEVEITGDTDVESDETFFVNLSNPTNGATIADGQGVGTISNDDGAVPGSVSIDNVAISEGDSGTTVATFTVTRSGGTAAFDVDFATADDTATVADGDYVANTGTLSFAEGVDAQTIEVEITGDTDVESDETFFVNLSNPTNGASISDGQGVGTITNDDGAVPADIRLYVVDADTDEVLRELLPGDTIDPAEFPDNNFAIMAEVADGVGEDSLVFYVDGEAVKTENLVPYAIFGDSSGDFRGGPVFSEGPHTVSATAFSGANGRGTALATVSVDVMVGDIDTPLVSIDNVTISEGDSGTTVATFTVTRTGDTAAFDVDFATADGTATVVDGDYVANVGTLSFAEGVNTQTIEVEITGDTDVEPNETFFVNLSNPTNGATIADGQGVGTITNDDGAVPADIRLYVVDADTDEVLRELLPGDTIDPAEFPDKNFSILAEVAESVGEDSLVFYVDGEAVKTENLVPYAIFGDSSGDFRGGPVFSDGPHTVSATAFSGANGSGTALATVAVDVTVGGLADIDAFVVNNNQANQVLINQGGSQAGVAGDLDLGIEPEGGVQLSRHVALGDLDGDGDLDGFVANWSQPDQVLINQGGDQGGTEGDFDLGIAPEGGDTSTALALGDLDSDGDLDAFVVTSGFLHPNVVLINQGGEQGGAAGDFNFGITPEGGAQISIQVALGDLDGDGDLDAFIVNDGLNQVLINQGGDQGGIGGDFNIGIAPDGGSQLSESIALGDFDGDGDLDAFIVNFDQPNQVLINQGGAQGGTEADFDLGIAPEGGDTIGGVAVALGDLDGDGDFDAFIANSNRANQVLINQGGEQGGTEGDFDLGIEPEGGVQQTLGVELGDLDGDGDLDALLVNGLNHVLINQGGDQGGIEGDFDLGIAPEGGVQLSYWAALGDLDGDGGVPPVDENGLPNIGQDGLLPSMYVDTIV